MPHEPNLTPPTLLAAIYAFVAGLSLNEIAAAVGIFVAIGTFSANLFFQNRRDSREVLKLEYDLGMHEDRRVRHARGEKME